MKLKQRLSATVDAVLIEAGQEAVARGQAANLSAWVNDALKLKRAHDQRLEALTEFVSAFESEYGEISPREMVAAARRARIRARPVRSPGPNEAESA